MWHLLWDCVKHINPMSAFLALIAVCLVFAEPGKALAWITAVVCVLIAIALQFAQYLGESV